MRKAINVCRHGHRVSYRMPAGIWLRSAALRRENPVPVAKVR